MLSYKRYVTFEELGRSGEIGVDVKITCRVWPEEKRTYCYPGCPSEVEYISCEVLLMWGKDWKFSREDRPDWFQLLDNIIDIKCYNCNMEEQLS